MDHVFWLSFADETGNLGACVVTVTDEAIEAQRPRLERDFPNHDRVQGPVVAAASAEAWAQGCNPGGQMLSTEIPEEKLEQIRACYPFNVLMQREEIAAYEAIYEQRQSVRH